MKSILIYQSKRSWRHAMDVFCPTLAATVCMILLQASVARAQAHDIRFEELSIDEGLSQTICLCIAQDKTGYMWFGTEDGLNKYDGYRFVIDRHNPEDPNSIAYNHILALYVDCAGKLWIGTFDSGLDMYDPDSGRYTHFRHDPDNQNTLSDDFIHAIIEDRKGYIWIGTQNGLNRYDINQGTFERYLHDPDDAHSISHNIVRTIYEDRSGTIWIGTEGGGLNRYVPQKDKFVSYMTDPGDRNSLSHNSVRAIHEDRTGILWIGTVGGGLNAFDKEKEKFAHYRNDPDDPGSLNHDQVYAILEDRNGTLWIGTNGGGLNKFDRVTRKFTRYVYDPNDPYSLSYNEIYAIYEDRSGVIWLGTYGGGVNKFDGKQKKFVHYDSRANDPNSLSQSIVWCIYEDKDGILWIGTHGGGLDRLDRKKDRYTHYRHDPNDPSSLSANIVRFVFEDRSGILWIGTHGGGLNRFDRKTGTFKAYRNIPDDPRSISHDELRSILEDSGGVLWIGTNGGGLNRFDRKSETFTRYQSDPNDPSSLSNDYVRFIYEDRDNDFWVGTQGGGLNKLDRATGKFIHYMTDPSGPYSISSDYVFSMLEDESGLFWLGTWGGGLNTFDKAAGRFSYYTERDGLPSNSVYGALMSDDGELWVSTNNGLSRFDPRTETFKNYNKDDGLQENEFNGNSLFKSESGEMFFGGVNGFNAFYPEKIKDNPHAPPVVITSFSKLNREITFDRPMEELDRLILSYKDYVFSFEFAALDYSAPSKNLYAYQMEGLDEDWVYIDSEKRFATYTTLPPGKYVFRVKGSNNDGIWNEEGVELWLQITPPFHATWWFRTLIIFIIAFSIYSWQKRRTKSVRMLAELQAAHDAQMSIMPQGPPRIESLDIAGICIPANEVGGDFYDYIYICDDPNKFCIVIGDVSGKAMKAAMVAVMSSGMIFSKTSESCSMHSTMTQLNRSLYFKTEEIVYTALCLASLDIGSRRLTYSLAGLNPPLLKSNGRVTPLEGVGPRFPLGMIPGTVYNEKSVQLDRSDVLIFYTDGLNESRNSAGDFYESEVLIELIEKMDTTRMTAIEIKTAIVNDVKQFRGSETRQDDMTVIVVKLI